MSLRKMDACRENRLVVALLSQSRGTLATVPGTRASIAGTPSSGMRGAATSPAAAGSRWATGIARCLRPRRTSCCLDDAACRERYARLAPDACPRSLTCESSVLRRRHQPPLVAGPQPPRPRGIAHARRRRPPPLVAHLDSSRQRVRRLSRRRAEEHRALEAHPRGHLALDLRVAGSPSP